MHFVPEGQHDRSLARSAWERVPPDKPSRRVRYDRAQLNPEAVLFEDANQSYLNVNPGHIDYVNISIALD
jgi:hypothetical protein